MDYKYTGIILSKVDIAEVDRIYNIYTLEAGKIRILGKGVRNAGAKLAGSLEPVTLTEINIARARGLGKITASLPSDNFLALKSDYLSMARIFFVFGILEKMIAAEERDEKIFELLSEYLWAMESLAARGTDVDEQKLDVVTYGFLFKFLDIMGYKINGERCMSCGGKLTDGDNYFTAQHGGFVCGCSSRGLRGIKCTAGAIKLIRLFLKNNIANFKKISAPPADIRNIKIIAGEMIKWIC